MYLFALAGVEYQFSILSGGYSFENKTSTRTEKKTKKTLQLCENIMNKYNNYKQNDNIIVRARNIILVGAGVGVGIRVDTTDQLGG